MSGLPFAAIPHTLADDLDISDGAYRLYGVLLKYAWKEGETWVSQETLSEVTGVSIRTTQRRIKELSDAGVIQIDQRRARKTNLIRVSTEDELMAIYGAKKAFDTTNLSGQEGDTTNGDTSPDTTNLSPLTRQICQVSIEEEVKKKKQDSLTSLEQASVSSSTQVCAHQDDLQEAARETKDRILVKVARNVAASVPSLDDEELWSLYGRSLRVNQEIGSDLSNANEELVASITQEIRKRVLG